MHNGSNNTFPLMSSPKCLVVLLVTRAMCIAHELASTLPAICTGPHSPTYYTKMPNVAISGRWHVTCWPMEHHISAHPSQCVHPRRSALHNYVLNCRCISGRVTGFRPCLHLSKYMRYIFTIEISRTPLKILCTTCGSYFGRYRMIAIDQQRPLHTYMWCTAEEWVMLVFGAALHLNDEIPLVHDTEMGALLVKRALTTTKLDKTRHAVVLCGSLSRFLLQ